MSNILNGNQGQIRARDQDERKFIAGQQLYSLITTTTNPKYGITSLARIGIQAPVATHILLNNIDFEIGKTGILEIRDLNITSIKFVEDTDDSVIIDFIINAQV